MHHTAFGYKLQAGCCVGDGKYPDRAVIEYELPRAQRGKEFLTTWRSTTKCTKFILKLSQVSTLSRQDPHNVRFPPQLLCEAPRTDPDALGIAGSNTKIEISGQLQLGF